MGQFNRRQHWNKIYNEKEINEVSWYQPVPETSLEIVQSLGIAKPAHIIDIGGGDSLFADHLLDLGYTNITVLDISEKAIEKAKTRLGPRGREINWIVGDAVEFESTETYDLWHDRAAFHFLTREEEIHSYLDRAQEYIREGGYLVIGTFSEDGPEKCSGIRIKQYSEKTLTELLKGRFEKIECFTIDHHTPFGTVQNFLFCSYRKIL